MSSAVVDLKGPPRRRTLCSRPGRPYGFQAVVSAGGPGASAEALRSFIIRRLDEESPQALPLSMWKMVNKTVITFGIDRCPRGPRCSANPGHVAVVFAQVALRAALTPDSNIAAVSTGEMTGATDLIGHRRFFLKGVWIKVATTTF